MEGLGFNPVLSSLIQFLLNRRWLDVLAIKLHAFSANVKFEYPTIYIQAIRKTTLFLKWVK